MTWYSGVEKLRALLTPANSRMGMYYEGSQCQLTRSQRVAGNSVSSVACPTIAQLDRSKISQERRTFILTANKAACYLGIGGSSRDIVPQTLPSIGSRRI